MELLKGVHMPVFAGSMYNFHGVKDKAVCMLAFQYVHGIF
jgi:hypothetical protein